LEFVELYFTFFKNLYKFAIVECKYNYKYNVEIYWIQTHILCKLFISYYT